MPHPATIAACITPPGTGAIATIGICGPDAANIIRASFRCATKRAVCENTTESERIWFGKFGRDSTFDEVVLSLRHGPEEWWEVHCHGGAQVVAWMLEVLAHANIQCVAWGHFLKRIEPERAEALEILARTATARTAAIALDQVNGAWERAMTELNGLIREGRASEARTSLDRIEAWSTIGAHLAKPWVVALAGPPNAGKSSLVNALAGYQRSVVTPIPGTTRDVVATSLSLDGWPIELLDTAGLHDGPGELEAEAMALSVRTAQEADLTVWVIDGERPAQPQAKPGSLIVWNKCDLAVAPAPWHADLSISTRSGEGIAALVEQIARRLVPVAPPPGSAIPFLQRHFADLRRRRAALSPQAAQAKEPIP